MSIINFILENTAAFFTCGLLARFAMQWSRAPFRNPIGQFVIAVTDWMVKPARRVIPTAWSLDLPSVALAWLIQAIYLGARYALTGLVVTSPSHIAIIAVSALFQTAGLACYLVIGVVIISALLSWINPHAPIAPVINAIAGPLLKPLQRVIPLIGGIDVSPIALFFVIQLVQLLLGSAQEQVIAAILPMK